MSESTIMERLKHETWPQHQQAERMELERQLGAGTLPRELYVEYLAQRRFLHGALESALRRLRESDSRVRDLITTHRMHEHRAAADIEFFGTAPASTKPLPATTGFIEHINTVSQENPIALLGIFYVFEGSTNGARFIAKALRNSYGIDLDGTRYLDPYGEEQRLQWSEFKEIMNRIEFSHTEQEAILDAARATFDGIMQIDGQILDSQPESA